MKNRLRLASIVGLALAAAASVLPAAGQTRGEAFMSSRPMGQDTVASSATEFRDAASIVAEWNNTLTQAFGWDVEAVADLQARIGRLPPSALAELSGLQTWSQFTGTLLRLESSTLAKAGGAKAGDQRDPGVAKAIAAAQKVLGDQNRDLTFIPVQPCRIFDTRFESLGNPFAGRYPNATTKYFWAFNSSGSGDFSFYGGNTGCAELVQTNAATLNGTAPYAVMIKLTIVGPAGSGSYASAVRSGDPNPVPNLVNGPYCDLSGVAPCFATIVVPICRGTTGCAGTRDISIQTNMALDLAGEVMGYFVKPQATALECTFTTTSIVIAAGARDFTNVFCPAGYTVTGGGVASTTTNDLQTMNASTASGNTWFTSMTNNGASSKTFTFSATCCRVPGRP